MNIEINIIKSINFNCIVINVKKGILKIILINQGVNLVEINLLTLFMKIFYKLSQIVNINVKKGKQKL